MKNTKTYPYGFRHWMNQLFQAGNRLKVWDLNVMNYESKLCFDSWLVYFMDGLSPIKAILQDIKEGGE